MQDILPIFARSYRYDALNRLRISQIFGLSGNTFMPLNSYRETFTYDKDGNILNLGRMAETTLMDTLEYKYYAGNNRLRQVRDQVPASAFTDDIDDQLDSLNYKYDNEGNLIEDVSEKLKIHWTYYGKIKQIDSAGQPKLRFYYDALGNRVRKEIIKERREEVYVRDARGNIKRYMK